MSGNCRALLKKNGILLSIAENSLQNAYAERLNGIIKNDYLDFFHTDDISLLRKHLKRTIWLYNHERPHSALGYMTPVEYETGLRGDGVKHEKMLLYDFSTKVLDEFFSGMANRNDCPYLNKEQAPHQNVEPVIPVGQGYSFEGCPPAEPTSASPCQGKNSDKQKPEQKKLSTISYKV
jgi:hypothetical protein